MRKESWPSISSKSAVSNKTLAIALLSTYSKINQVGVRGGRAATGQDTPLPRPREMNECDRIKGIIESVERSGECADANSVLLCFDYVGCLRSFLALGNLEFNLVTFLQAFVAFGADRAVMNKYVWPICASDEPVSFRVIEPLNGSFQSIHEEPLFCTSPGRGLKTCPQ
jgi:hypothetical protein